MTDPNSPAPESQDERESVDDSSPRDDQFEALFAEALELQVERQRADDQDELEAMIAENFSTATPPGDPSENLSDEDAALALPDLPDDEPEEPAASPAASPGIDPELFGRLESELEMLKQQKKTLHQQMAQRAGRFESAEAHIVQLERQLATAARQAQGVASDFANFRDRTEREREQQKTSAAEGLLKSFLAVYDNLTRALDHAEDKDGPLGQGVAMTLSQFLATLESSGVTVVSSEVGKPFDPTYHEAMQQAYSAKFPEGTITEILLGGFMLGERLLRPAMVNVSQGPDPALAAVPKKKGTAAKKKARSSGKAQSAKSKGSASGTGKAKKTKRTKKKNHKPKTNKKNS